MPTISTTFINSGDLILNIVIRYSLQEFLYNFTSLCVENWLSEKWRFVEKYCLNSFGLASDWVKLLFVWLSGFRSDILVLVSNEVVWINKKIRFVINSGYFKIWCQTSLIPITVPCLCFQFRFFSSSACCNLWEVTCLVWYKYNFYVVSSYHQQMQTLCSSSLCQYYEYICNNIWTTLMIHLNIVCSALTYMQ